MDLAAGDRVVAVEYRLDGSRTGREYPGWVETGPTTLFGIVGVRYDDPALNGRNLTDPYYGRSGWRAWDGELRWRLRKEKPGGR